MNEATALNLSPQMAERCTLAAPLEIAALLRELRDRRVAVKLHRTAGDSGLVSLVVDVEPGNARVAFDGSRSGAGHAALDGAVLEVDAEMDGIRIHFAAGPAESARLDGHDVLVAPLPASVLRVQRRAEFRIETPLAEPLYCRTEGGASTDGAESRFKVYDLSATGLALAWPKGLPEPAPGTRLESCRIDLPGCGVLHAALEVVDLRDRRTAAGSRRLVGCRFRELAGPSATVLQRYIINLQRERRARC